LRESSVEKEMMIAAKSPRGGADLIAKLVEENTRRGRRAIKACGHDLLLFMSVSPRDLADLFEKLDKRTRKILFDKFSVDSIANMARSPGDWERIIKSMED
jgi:hypothetical protein